MNGDKAILLLQLYYSWNVRHNLILSSTIITTISKYQSRLEDWCAPWCARHPQCWLPVENRLVLLASLGWWWWWLMMVTTCAVRPPRTLPLPIISSTSSSLPGSSLLVDPWGHHFSSYQGRSGRRRRWFPTTWRFTLGFLLGTFSWMTTSLFWWWWCCQQEW